MRQLIALIILCAVFTMALAGRFRLGRGLQGMLGAPPTEHPLLPQAQWFTQRLDHFTASDQRTWQQRYYINNTFFDPKYPGPVFLMIGGEGSADPRWMVAGAWIEYAQQFKALCINLEHRFYGKSHPTKDVSTKSLRYLSSQQALADLANFIGAMNEVYRFDDNVKWIALGGSYPGSLAAWLRLKYPHLVHAAVSTSGPLLAKLNFNEYYDVVVDALTAKTGSRDCVNRVKEAHNQVTEMFDSRPEILEAKFRLCKGLRNATKNDVRNFYNSLADNFADVVQYNEDNRIGARDDYKNLTINTVCNILTEAGSSPAYERMAIFNSIILDKSNQSCLDYDYANLIRGLQNDSWEADNVKGGARQWIYQTCTEFGFYQTSSGEPEIFGNNFTVDFFTQQCQDIYGKKFNRDFIERSISNTNNVYGALDIAVDRVVFVHGSVDPWHALGITKTIDSGAPAIYIEGTAHCANMYPSREEDPAALKEARVEIVQYLHQWLDTISI